MNFDAMGNYYGPVNDMFNEPDTEANVKPVTQTITTDPKTGEQMMTLKGRPQDLSAANPNTPTVTQPRFTFGAPPAQAPAPQPAAPAVPDQTFSRMQQVESGGRNYDTQGRPLTSSAGAMFANQVMPSTAMNPGYGIRPAASQTPEEYNRVGQEYYQAMLKQFGGDQAKAVAAYNAGPGRVQQNIAANQGQLNPQQLPQETQGYLQKVLGAINPIGTAQAAAPAPTLANTPLPAPTTTAPLMQPQPVPQTNAFPGTPSAQMPGQAPAPVAPVPPEAPQAQPMPQAQPLTGTAATLPSLQAQPYVDQFLSAQSDPALMAKLAYDKNAPDYIKRAASSQQYEQLRFQRETEQAKQTVNKAIEENDGNTLAKLLTSRKEEGSIAKAFLFSLIGFQSGAENEVNKMGLKATWQQTINPTTGEQALIKFAKDGLPIEGYDANGKAITGNALAAYAGAGAGKADYVGGSVVNDTTGQIGRIVSRNNATYVESGGKLYPATTAWRNNTVGTDLALAAKRALIDIEGKSAGEALSYVRKWNVEHPDARIPEDVNGIQQLRNIAGGAGVAAPSMPGVQTPVPTGGATTTTTTPAVNPTVEKAKEIGRTEIVKKSAEIVADSANIITKLDSYDKDLEILDKQQTNFGGLFSEGIIPGEKTVGKIIGSPDYQNTNAIMQDIKAIQSSAAKMLGVNPTDKDLQFVTENAPNENSSNEEVARYIRKYRAAAKRTLDIANKQVESGGRYVPTQESESAPGTKENPIKL